MKDENCLIESMFQGIHTGRDQRGNNATFI